MAGLSNRQYHSRPRKKREDGAPEIPFWEREVKTIERACHPPIAFIFISVLCLSAIGSIVLLILPGFRLTFGNVIIFVLGAFPGMFVLPNVYSKTNSIAEMYTLALIGAIIAGATIVWVEGYLVRMFKK